MRTTFQRGWAPRLSSPGERERNSVMVIRVGVNMLQFCSVSNSLSHTTLSIKWALYFSKELCRSSLLCRCYDSAYICICVCIVVHDYTTQIVLSYSFCYRIFFEYGWDFYILSKCVSLYMDFHMNIIVVLVLGWKNDFLWYDLWTTESRWFLLFCSYWNLVFFLLI